MSIIDGATRPLSQCFESLLEDVLLPLHRPSEMIEWRDQVPVIAVSVKIIHYENVKDVIS